MNFKWRQKWLFNEGEGRESIEVLLGGKNLQKVKLKNTSEKMSKARRQATSFSLKHRFSLKHSICSTNTNN